MYITLKKCPPPPNISFCKDISKKAQFDANYESKKCEIKFEINFLQELKTAVQSIKISIIWTKCEERELCLRENILLYFWVKTKVAYVWTTAARWLQVAAKLNLKHFKTSLCQAK